MRSVRALQSPRLWHVHALPGQAEVWRARGQEAGMQAAQMSRKVNQVSAISLSIIKTHYSGP